ncbi:enoyl-CoA hydratase [Sesbania bispinosa]|nr:enoyl-CoA hydratase [Sesbania bispinosa]
MVVVAVVTLTVVAAERTVAVCAREARWHGGGLHREATDTRWFGCRLCTRWWSLIEEDVGGCETRRTPTAGCGGGGETRIAKRRHVRVRQWLRSPVRAKTGVMVTCDVRLLSVELREGAAEVRVAAVMAVRRGSGVSMSLP